MKKADAFIVFFLYLLLSTAFALFAVFSHAFQLALQGDLTLLENDEMFLESLNVYDPAILCVTTLSAAALTFLYAGLRNIPLGAFFRLKRPSPALLAKSLLLMLSAMVLSGAARIAVYALTGNSLSEDEEMLVALSSYPRPLVFVLIAILPAVCEEILFRGFILSALRKAPEVPRAGLRDERFAILLCSILFAALHMDLLNLLPIFILGLALSYAACATGSLAIPMILHFFNNGTSVILYWLFPDF